MAQAYLQRMTPQTMMLTLLSCLACLYVAGRCVRIPIDRTPYPGRYRRLLGISLTLLYDARYMRIVAGARTLCTCQLFACLDPTSRQQSYSLHWQSST